MAHSKSALKRWRQNEAHRARNKPVRTGARSAVKRARALIHDGAPADEAQAAISEASSILDRAAKHNVIHPNAASRHKSRMMKALARAAGAPTAAEAAKKTRKPAAKKPAAAKKTAAKAAAKPRTTRKKAAE